MNADDGAVVNNLGSNVTYRLAPYGSIILYASTKNAGAVNISKEVPADNLGKKILALDQWDLKTDSLELKGISLFDWRTHGKLKFSSSEGIYTSSFNWEDKRTASHFYLDLGKVYFTAEVYINGKVAGKRVFAPYLLDITNYLEPGANKIEVRITTGQLNGFIGRAKWGDAHYKQFKNKEDQLMSAGLVGPVVIREEILKQNH